MPSILFSVQLNHTVISMRWESRVNRKGSSVIRTNFWKSIDRVWYD